MKIPQIRLPRSLRFQISARSLLILSVLLALIGFLQYVLMQQFLYSNRAMTLQSQIRTVPAQAWTLLAADPVANDPRSPLSSMRMPDTSLAFIAKDGTFTALFEDARYGPTPQLSRADYEQAIRLAQPDRIKPSTGPLIDYKIITDSEGQETLVVLQPIVSYGGPLGIVQISTSIAPMQDILLRQLLIFLSLSVIALLIGFLTFLPVLRKTLVPLSRVVDTVERINAGNLDERLPTDQGQLETDRLSAAFNAMLERLEISFEAEKEAKELMRRFIADASHELRTPLTSIHGFLEVLLRGAAAHPDKLQNALHSMHGESARLNKLVNDLFLLARLDRAPDFTLTSDRLDTLLAQMVPQLRLLAGDRRVEFEIAAGIEAELDRDRIKQVILNLFQNAVQHTDEQSGVIVVSLKQNGQKIRLAVQDNGPGIPAEHLDHLFERFYRIDTARARKNGGAGLGLAITRSIVELHGGTVTCASTPGAGTAFSVLLPRPK